MNPSTSFQASGAQESDEQLPLARYWNIVVKRIWTTSLVFVLVVTLAAVFTFKQQKVYQAEATIIIDLALPNLLGRQVEQPVVEFSPGDMWAQDKYFSTQYSIIKSRSLAEKVVEKYGLADNLVFLGLDKVDDEDELRDRLAKIDPVVVLQHSIEVVPAVENRVVGVRASHTDPETAMLLANAVTETYAQGKVDRRMESTYAAYDWLTKQYQDVKARLEGSEEALYKFKKDNNILSTSLEDRQSITRQRLMSLNDRLTTVRAERIQLLAEVRQIRAARAKPGSRESFESVLSSPLVQQLKATRADLLRQQADLGPLMDKHPAVVSVREKLARVESDLDHEINSIHDSAENRLKVLQRTETALQAEVEAVKSQALEINQKEIKYTQLLRENETNTKLHEVVLTRLKETDLSRLMRDSNVRVLDRAEVPLIPTKPKVMLNMLVGIILGLGAGVAMAFLRETLDGTVHTQEQVEAELGLTFLGVIPNFQPDQRDGEAIPSGQSELYVHDFPKSSLAECVRTIRTNLMFMSPDRRFRRLLISSAGPQEGKTTTALNIAIAMSQSGSRVLLVDTDMRRPRVHKVFDMDNLVGLTSLLLGEKTYEEAIGQTRVPNLDVLRCGPIPPNPTELLHTRRFVEIVEELDTRYDVVIYDSPPIVAVADSMVLSNLVDGVIFVIRSGVTRLDLAKRAKERLVGVNGTILGSVVNAIDLGDRRSGYYYSYYRRYSQYYQLEEDELEEAEASSPS